ncbi:MAG TPA: hypothetical protein VH416_06275 [Gaiellaceae bacterium]
MNAYELELLDRFVPPFDATADWTDVLRRAGADRPRRARRALAAVLAAAIVAPAAAFGVNALLERGPSGIGLAADLRGAFTGTLTLDVRHTILARRDGRIVIHPLGRLGEGGIRSRPGAPVRWSLEVGGSQAAARSIAVVRDSGRRTVLCAPCRASGGTGRLDRSTLAALVNGRAAAVAVTGAGAARGRLMLEHR